MTDQPQGRVMVQVICADGTVSVPGEPVAEHFAITPKTTAEGKVRAFGLNLAHVRTGRLIPVHGFPCREELRELAEKLAGLPLDWAAANADGFGPDQLRLLDATIDAWTRNRRHHTHRGRR